MSRDTHTIETQVAIIGGGPVGLCLALELGSRGVDCAVLERRGAGEPVFPTANHIGVRTMEQLRRHGLSDEVRRAFRPDWGGDFVCLTHLGGAEVCRVEDALADSRDRSDSPEREVWAPKPCFDPILERAVHATETAAIHHGVQIDSVSVTRSGVACAGRDAEGGRVEVRAAFAVACDGGSSRVRESLGIELVGPPAIPVRVHSAFFRSRRVADQVPPGAVQYLLLGTEAGPTPSPVGAALMITVDGHHLWRIHGLGLDADDEAKTAARLAELGAPDAEILAMSAWTPRQALATSFRAGRVFLAGDAAHVVTPFGGLGVNTGMADAFDLGWKLDATLRGWGGPRLLEESYETERSLAALDLLRYQGVDFSGPDPERLGPPLPIHKIPTEELWRTDEAGETARRAFGVGLIDSRGDEYVKPQIDLGTRYDSSPIVCDDGTPPIDRSDNRVYEATTKPGGRAPHVSLRGGRSILDLYGRGLTLVCTDAANGTDALQRAAEERRVPLRIEAVPEASAAYPLPFTLVRPDGVVAWRGSALPSEPAGVIETVVGSR
ncbi:MAG: FAD-dependent monooxygenase [Myxococcota bacterium]